MDRVNTDQGGQHTAGGPYKVTRAELGPSDTTRDRRAYLGVAEIDLCGLQLGLGSGHLEFLEATGWKPDFATTFAGALRFSQYGFIKRALMKKIAAEEMHLETDGEHDLEFTSWASVAHFAADFEKALRMLEREGFRVVDLFDLAIPRLEQPKLMTNPDLVR